MLAHDGLGKHFRIFRLASKIAIDANPSHVAIPAHLFLADDWNIVFGLASDDASVAAERRYSGRRSCPTAQAM